MTGLANMAVPLQACRTGWDDILVLPERRTQYVVMGVRP